MALKGSSCRDWAAAAARRLGALVARHGSLLLCVAFLLLVSSTQAEATTAADMTPWGLAAKQICVLLTGIVGKSLAIVAVVVAGIAYAMGEGASKAMLGAVAFGAGMVLLGPEAISFFFGVDVMCGVA